MNLIFVVVTVLLLLVVAGIVLLVTSLERPQQGEILLRTGFGKTKFSSSPNSKLLCLPVTPKLHNRQRSQTPPNLQYESRQLTPLTGFLFLHL